MKIRFDFLLINKAKLESLLKMSSINVRKHFCFIATAIEEGIRISLKYTNARCAYLFLIPTFTL